MCGCCSIARNYLHHTQCECGRPGAAAHQHPHALHTALLSCSICANALRLNVAACLKRAQSSETRAQNPETTPATSTSKRITCCCAACHQSLSPCLKLECSSNPVRIMARCAEIVDRANRKHTVNICEAPGGTSGRRCPMAMVGSVQGCVGGVCLPLAYGKALQSRVVWRRPWHVRVACVLGT